jgi:hypothetical protein
MLTPGNSNWRAVPGGSCQDFIRVYSILRKSGNKVTPEEKIRENAQLVIARFSQLPELKSHFGYNHESVKWLDGFIERERSRRDINTVGTEKLIQVLGSYLGECVIHTYGGMWREQEGQWGVFFDDSNSVFPFNKVLKQFRNGREDSILSFFEIIALVFKKP